VEKRRRSGGTLRFEAQILAGLLQRAKERPSSTLIFHLASIVDRHRLRKRGLGFNYSVRSTSQKSNCTLIEARTPGREQVDLRLLYNRKRQLRKSLVDVGMATLGGEAGVSDNEVNKRGGYRDREK